MQKYVPRDVGVNDRAAEEKGRRTRLDEQGGRDQPVGRRLDHRESLTAVLEQGRHLLCQREEILHSPLLSIGTVTASICAEPRDLSE
jgi:transposase